MFLVICYAVHNRTVASIDKRETYEDAWEFLKKDVQNTYDEEIEICGIDPRDVTLEIRDKDKVILQVFNGEIVWTWEIREV